MLLKFKQKILAFIFLLLIIKKNICCTNYLPKKSSSYQSFPKT